MGEEKTKEFSICEVKGAFGWVRSHLVASNGLECLLHVSDMDIYPFRLNHNVIDIDLCIMSNLRGKNYIRHFLKGFLALMSPKDIFLKAKTHLL